MKGEEKQIVFFTAQQLLRNDARSRRKERRDAFTKVVAAEITHNSFQVF